MNLTTDVYKILRIPNVLFVDPVLTLKVISVYNVQIVVVIDVVLLIHFLVKYVYLVII